MLIIIFFRRENTLCSALMFDLHDTKKIKILIEQQQEEYTKLYYIQFLTLSWFNGFIRTISPDDIRILPETKREKNYYYLKLSINNDNLKLIDGA